jgi:hypothetical protein
LEKEAALPYDNLVTYIINRLPRCKTWESPISKLRRTSLLELYENWIVDGKGNFWVTFETIYTINSLSTLLCIFFSIEWEIT